MCDAPVSLGSNNENLGTEGRKDIPSLLIELIQYPSPHLSRKTLLDRARVVTRHDASNYVNQIQNTLNASLKSLEQQYLQAAEVPDVSAAMPVLIDLFAHNVRIYEDIRLLLQSFVTSPCELKQHVQSALLPALRYLMPSVCSECFNVALGSDSIEKSVSILRKVGLETEFTHTLISAVPSSYPPEPLAAMQQCSAYVGAISRLSIPFPHLCTLIQRLLTAHCCKSIEVALKADTSFLSDNQFMTQLRSLVSILDEGEQWLADRLVEAQIPLLASDPNAAEGEVAEAALRRLPRDELLNTTLALIMNNKAISPSLASVVGPSLTPVLTSEALRRELAGQDSTAIRASLALMGGDGSAPELVRRRVQGGHVSILPREYSGLPGACLQLPLAHLAQWPPMSVGSQVAASCISVADELAVALGSAVVCLGTSLVTVPLACALVMDLLYTSNGLTISELTEYLPLPSLVSRILATLTDLIQWRGVSPVRVDGEDISLCVTMDNPWDGTTIRLATERPAQRKQTSNLGLSATITRIVKRAESLQENAIVSRTREILGDISPDKILNSIERLVDCNILTRRDGSIALN